MRMYRYCMRKRMVYRVIEMPLQLRRDAFCLFSCFVFQQTTLWQHYYPEGGWGWLLAAIGIIIQCLSQMSIGVLTEIIASQFQPDLFNAGEISIF